MLSFEPGSSNRLFASDKSHDLTAQLGFRDLDLAFAEFIAGQESSNAQQVGVLAGLISQRLGQQDTCVDLRTLNDVQLKLIGVESAQELSAIALSAVSIHVIDETQSAYGEINQPIVMFQNYVYLQRYWFYENRLIEQIKQRVGGVLDIDMTKSKAVLSELFDHGSTECEVDWQQVAICMAASKSFSMITGGPGTGKTTTVAKLLVLLHCLQPADVRPQVVKLVAPTGKAAARLAESLAMAKARLPDQYQGALEVSCSTIHRLLGSIPNRVDFQHGRDHQLHVDVLIVDEASMVDLPLMSKLFDATGLHAKIILLGDQNQLSSVEAGSVLSDICAAALGEHSTPQFSADMSARINDMCGQLPNNDTAASKPNVMSDCLTILQKSHRFSEFSGIGKLASQIIAPSDHGETVIDLLRDPKIEDVNWFESSSPNELVARYVKRMVAFFNALAQQDMHDAFNQFEQLQILCASRKGDWGVDYINTRVEVELANQGYITLNRTDYVGRPIMLAQNDHTLQVYNGDIGIVMPDPDQPDVMKAWFKQSDNSMRGILISRLPVHETVYAMTIHKSQGSEFNEVFMCLPQLNGMGSEQHISRELIYTGLTRAKQRFSLYADKTIVLQSLQRKCRRTSGLAIRLG